MQTRLVFLDIIRGLAALSVFFSHLNYSYLEKKTFLYKIISGYHYLFQKTFWANGGIHPGVLVFIVLSGFCIHMPQAVKGHMTVNLKIFIRKRFFRIYPVLFVSLVLSMISDNIIHQSITISFENILENLFFISAVYPLEPPIGNTILLTVIVECLLYCFYPVGLWIIRKSSWVHLLTICFFIYVVNILWLKVFTDVNPTWVQRNLWALLIFWWCGAFSVHLCVNNSITQKINLSLCFLFFGAYLFICTLFAFKGAHVIKSLIFLIVVSALLIALFNHAQIKHRSFVKEYLSIILKKIGETSYSLYVIHIPVLNLLNYYWSNSFANLLVHLELFYLINILLVIFVTILLYVFVEKPSHNYAKNAVGTGIGKPPFLTEAKSR